MSGSESVTNTSWPAPVGSAIARKVPNVVGRWALWTGLVGALGSALVFGVVPAIGGVILGIIGLTRSAGVERGTSLAGLMLGLMGMGIFTWLLVLTLTGQMPARGNAN